MPVKNGLLGSYRQVPKSVFNSKECPSFHYLLTSREEPCRRVKAPRSQRGRPSEALCERPTENWCWYRSGQHTGVHATFIAVSVFDTDHHVAGHTVRTPGFQKRRAKRQRGRASSVCDSCCEKCVENHKCVRTVLRTNRRSKGTWKSFTEYQ